MMDYNLLEYKGYRTRIEFDVRAGVLIGKIEGIRDLVNFESEDPGQIEKEFHSAVDDYLDFCKEIGKNPDKEYRGSFNVRIDPDLHKRLAAYAFKHSESLNTVVGEAIAAYTSVKKSSEKATTDKK